MPSPTFVAGLEHAIAARHGARTVSAKGLRFIEQWEGCVLHPYNDSSSYATIGIGHLLHRSPVTVSDVTHFNAYRGLNGKAKPHPFDQADALALLAVDVGWVQNDIRAYVKRPLTAQQFDALADLVFNCGPAPLSGAVGAAYNAGRFDAAANDMQAWCHSAGQVVEGLVRRREAEMMLLLHGSYS